LAAGIELAHVPSQQIDLFSVAARYSRPQTAFTLLANNMFQGSASFSFRSEKRKTEIVTELSVVPGPERWESLYTVGTRMEFKTSCIKTFFNSRLQLGTFLEEQIAQAMRLKLCADFDYRKNVYKFGFGITLNF